MIWKNLFILGLLPLAVADPDPKKHKGGGHKGDEHHETSLTTTPIESSSVSAPPLRNHSTSEPHTPFTETATTTGALTATSVGTGIPSEGVAAGATSYPADGKLHHAEPAPFEPAGGVGTNGSTPVYNAKSDFDFESLVRIRFGEEESKFDTRADQMTCRLLLYTKNGWNTISFKMDSDGSTNLNSKQLVFPLQIAS